MKQDALYDIERYEIEKNKIKLAEFSAKWPKITSIRGTAKLRLMQSGNIYGVFFKSIYQLPPSLQQVGWRCLTLAIKEELVLMTPPLRTLIIYHKFMA